MLIEYRETWSGHVAAVDASRHLRTVPVPLLQPEEWHVVAEGRDTRVRVMRLPTPDALRLPYALAAEDLDRALGVRLDDAVITEHRIDPPSLGWMHPHKRLPLSLIDPGYRGPALWVDSPRNPRTAWIAEDALLSELAPYRQGNPSADALCRLFDEVISDEIERAEWLWRPPEPVASTFDLAPLPTAALFATPTHLYRLFNAAGDLLYVGITVSLPRRMYAHSREKQWWGDVAKRTHTLLANRYEALKAESNAIATENPRYNVAGKVDA